MPDNADVLIIGAGAAGLTAASELSTAKVSVQLLEASNRAGGRIFTDCSCGFPVELGAEFVHGRPPEIVSLAKANSLRLVEVSGEYRRRRNGLWADAGEVMDKVNHLFENMPGDQPDQSFAHYISSSKYSGVSKEMALSFVEGFHAADPERVSVHWLIHTTRAEDRIGGESSRRVADGYEALIQSMFQKIGQTRCQTLFNERVSEIRWRRGQVTVTTPQKEHRAAKAIITLPLGVFKTGAVRVDPPLQDKAAALRNLEMGPVIRVSLCFHDRFWEQLPEMRNLSFLFTDDPVFPTWWSSNPLPYPILTGWAAGKYARALQGQNRNELRAKALASLSRILEIGPRELEGHLVQGFVHDWQSDPLFCGAYSYVACGGEGAASAYAAPVEDTLFFAGEATNTEGFNGTVHGAIATGSRVAQEVLKACGREIKPGPVPAA